MNNDITLLFFQMTILIKTNEVNYTTYCSVRLCCRAGFLCNYVNVILNELFLLLNQITEVLD